MSASLLPICARFRVRPEDFQVEERLGFDPVGEGEHLFVWIEKRGANTAWVAGQLARWAGVAPMAVGYAGLKDRHAVTRQWFSVHLPRRVAPDADPAIEGVRVLRREWHDRKLKRGAHRGNRFAIVLRDVEGDIAAAESALVRIATDGVPNAFGEQRFGRDAGNVEQARDWLSSEHPARLPRDRRSLLLSAARSHLFNAVLAERIRRGDWNRPLTGDCYQLDGRGSWFGPETTITDEIAGRVQRGDIHPTGPLWGAGDPPTLHEVLHLETTMAANEPALCAGLVRFGLKQERRALRVCPRDLSWQRPSGDPDALQLDFDLPRGSFATAVMAAFCRAEDASAVR